MKKIVPRKLVITLNEDGTFKDGILMYQIDENGSIDKRKFYTMGIKEGIRIPDIEKITVDSIVHTGKGEAIDVSAISVVATAKGLEDAKPVE